jgi:hypothetical protein
LNDRVVELARSLKVTRGRKLRVDPTVVETNVHHPTDSRLLSDGVRVVSRLLRRAKKELGEEVSRLGKEAFRTLKPQCKAPDEGAAPHSATQGRGGRRRAKGSLP